MPYSFPTPPSPDSSPKTQHRRTRSCSATFSDDKGPGAFVSLGSLPKRKPTTKKPVFHLKDEELDQEDFERPRTPPLFLSLPTSFPGEGSVPFPSSLLSPLSPSTPVNSSPPNERTSHIPRTCSSPIILSNGKPLKPSLKSASSSPQIHVTHLRAQSAPATPSITKNVHFADSDKDLETVRVFNRSGKPASITQGGEDTETETEADSASYFPYTTTAPSPPPERLPVIDTAVTSSVPNLSPNNTYSNIHIESITFPKSRPAALYGSILVRNISFEKQVALRFTLDDWQTTSEVVCKYVVSLPSLPQPFPRTRTVGDAVGILAATGDPSSSATPEQTWDRFSFCVQLEYYEHKLSEQTIWFVGRFTCPIGEWWDNNDGNNYCLGFKRPNVSPNSSPSNLQASVPHAQQKSFTIPPTMKTTPVTPRVDAQTSVLPFPTFSPRTSPVSTDSPPLPVAEPIAAKSFPTPTTTPPSDSQDLKLSRSGLAERRGIHGGVRLSPALDKTNLTNYVAPSSIPVASPTQTPTPPRSRCGSFEDIGNPKSIPAATIAAPARSTPTQRVDSQSLTSSPPRISSPRPASSSSSSSSATPRNTRPVTSSWSSPTASTLPTPSGFSSSPLSQLSPILTSNELPSAALRAALVRQWCFAQSTPPTPGVFGNATVGSADVSPASEDILAPISSGASSSDGEAELMDVLSPTSGNGNRYAWWVGGGSADNNRPGSGGGWFNWSGGEPPVPPFWGSGATRARTDAYARVASGTHVGVES